MPAHLCTRFTDQAAYVCIFINSCLSMEEFPDCDRCCPMINIKSFSCIEYSKTCSLVHGYLLNVTVVGTLQYLFSVWQVSMSSSCKRAYKANFCFLFVSSIVCGVFHCNETMCISLCLLEVTERLSHILSVSVKQNFSKPCKCILWNGCTECAQLLWSNICEDLDGGIYH